MSNGEKPMSENARRVLQGLEEAVAIAEGRSDPAFVFRPGGDAVRPEVNVDGQTREQVLLTELYVGVLGYLDDSRIPEDEMERLLDTVLAAAEGRPFEPLALPFPRRRMETTAGES